MERIEVENLLSCVDEVLAQADADLVKIALGDLLKKIQLQTGVVYDVHAPKPVPKEVIERYRRKVAKDVGEENAVALGPSSWAANLCRSHSMDLMGSTCPLCGVVV